MKLVTIRLWTLGILALLFQMPMASHADAVYQWTPERFHPGGNVTGSMVTRPGGGSSLQVTTTSAGYNHCIVVSKGQLKAGHEYTAIIKYEVVTPPKFPDYFYMFARSSKLGQSRDIWQDWLGEPGVPSETRMSLIMPNNPAGDDWMFYVGTKGPASIIIDSFVIQDGTGFVYTPAVSGPKTVAFQSAKTAPLPTGANAFTIDPPAPKQNLTVSAADFGLVADGKDGPASTEVATANFAALKNALDAVRKKGASLFTIPKGVYRLYSNEAVPFENLNDVVVDGQGAELIFEKIHQPFAAITVNNCHRCVFKNFYVDWDWSVTPIATLGKVVTIAPDNLSADITFPDINAAETDLVVKSPWMSMTPMEPTHFRITDDLRLSTSGVQITKTNPTTVHVVFKSPLPLVVDQTYCIRHLYYDMAGFRISDSSHVLFDNVTIYSIPGMAWFNRGEMKNWEMHNCRIVRRPGSRHPLTAAADGFHIAESLGNVILDGCEFTGLGDDCINIHDNCFEGVTRVDDHTLTLANNPRYKVKFNVGDVVELCKADYSPMGYTSAVTAIKYTGNDTTLTLAEAMPTQVLQQSIIWNHHYTTSNVHIMNCNFHDTSGRGILLSAQNGTIENCTFDHLFSLAFQFHTEIVGYLWAEGHGASNIVIRNNTITDVNERHRFGGPAIYAGALIPAGPTRYPLFHDVLIEKNTFTDCVGPAVSLNSTKSVTVRNNTIKTNGTSPTATSLSGSLFAAYSLDVNLGNNTWSALPLVTKPGVVVDAATTSNVVSQGNVLASAK